ncbi:BapA/Bap/LapF family large adhesin [Acinetobacter sp. HY1485]|uniref:BapA/Bap/LapF family large adhesin n=1 Tax=Acinetobacter sp. HY1485 TaxID=2970918 RepID=UPI0022B98930|nr:BapA/Bap/LapF family large adhesin [Acinetobacter sp. HY1485]
MNDVYGNHVETTNSDVIPEYSPLEPIQPPVQNTIINITNIQINNTIINNVPVIQAKSKHTDLDAKITGISSQYSTEDHGTLIAEVLGVAVGREPTVNVRVEPAHQADVAIDFAVSSGLLNAGFFNHYHIVVKKYDPQTGTWGSYINSQDQSSLFNVDILSNQNSVIHVDGLEQGDYQISLDHSALLDLGVITTYSLNAVVTDTDLSKVGYVTGTAQGQLSTEIATVDNIEIQSSTQIQGKYGVLNITSDGHYSYVLNNNVAGLDQVETFKYTLSNGSTADLNIHIHSGTVLSQANTDHIQVDVDAHQAIKMASAQDISYSWSVGLLGLTLGKTSGSTAFTVAAGTMENVTVTFKSAQALSLGGGTHVNVYDAAGKLVATTASHNVLDAVGILTNGNQVTVTGLPEGTYTVAASSKGGLLSVGGAVQASISREIIELDHFVSSAEQVKGSLFEYSDVIGSSFSTIQVFNADHKASTILYQDGNSTSIAGDYGTLTVAGDGSYTYELKAGTDLNIIDHKENFSYTITDINGHTSSAEIKLDLAPQIYGTQGNAVSTAYDDTVTLDDGTFIFKALNDDAQGGNGHDTWTNFSATDHIDVSALFNHKVTADHIDQYIEVNTVKNLDGSKDTVLSIDRDGNHQSTELLTLKNVTTTLDDLLQHQQLVY